MKYIAAVCSVFLLCACLFSCFPNGDEASIYDDVLRLHVIAHSDSDEDQAVKLEVRDAVLAYTSEKLGECETFDEACHAAETMLGGIKEAAVKRLAECGYDYSVKVSLSRETYPRRYYSGAVLPAGEYNSLRVMLGDAEGHNWWCVLFPTVCTGFASARDDKVTKYDDDSTPAGLTPGEYRMIRGAGSGVRWKIKLRILEILEDSLAGLKKQNNGSAFIG